MLAVHRNGHLPLFFFFLFVLLLHLGLFELSAMRVYYFVMCNTYLFFSFYHEEDVHLFFFVQSLL